MNVEKILQLRARERGRPNTDAILCRLLARSDQRIRTYFRTIRENFHRQEATIAGIRTLVWEARERLHELTDDTLPSEERVAAWEARGPLKQTRRDRSVHVTHIEPRPIAELQNHNQELVPTDHLPR